ncbi:MAG: redox-regulated ATPase YchF [Synergistales bacterium]|nr:redox-regulated ATPase YchF [Synergistales bacterium]
MKLGIVGLPNVGKSTLFNAITSAGAEASNYPFCTIEPNIGVVAVPDERLEILSRMFKSEKITPAVVEFFDIAGLVKGASKGEGLGNTFLSHIREVNAIAHVVRCFDDEDIVHVDGDVNPIRDIETIELELVLADLETVERHVVKTERNARNDKSLRSYLELVMRVKEVLEAGRMIRTMDLTEEEERDIRGLNLLTSKPVIYVANVAEDQIGKAEENPHVIAVREYAEKFGCEVVSVCGKIEAEIAELEPEEKKEFLSDLGLEDSGLDRLVRAGYRLLGLISFLTAGEKESRAWTIKKGFKAPQAAGTIHTDFERGFIKAQVVSYSDLVELGGLAEAKAKGLVRMEGKDYVMKDGDVVEFRFNV